MARMSDQDLNAACASVIVLAGELRDAWAVIRNALADLEREDEARALDRLRRYMLLADPDQQPSEDRRGDQDG